MNSHKISFGFFLKFKRQHGLFAAERLSYIVPLSSTLAPAFSSWVSTVILESAERTEALYETNTSEASVLQSACRLYRPLYMCRRQLTHKAPLQKGLLRSVRRQCSLSPLASGCGSQLRGELTRQRGAYSLTEWGIAYDSNLAQSAYLSLLSSVWVQITVLHAHL